MFLAVPLPDNEATAISAYVSVVIQRLAMLLRKGSLDYNAIIPCLPVNNPYPLKGIAYSLVDTCRKEM